ncbi:hypothetical protein CPJCM30710_01300 [Clostridium polyendosporum]|uniref:Prealbumin-like fold domain-containing protein n=1 Tax=Clostridium polyendosporum TaxID=69208 RepID=A0A919VCZ3_9CLOT|nr:hypothetical protein [Clostridium polyendosporum]GIM27464.1 hypothetical protein CPJCM30710_01300 [Clostridium polyendosporum]
MDKNFNEIFDNISFDSFKFEDDFTAREETSKSHSKSSRKHDCDDISKSHSKSSRKHDCDDMSSKSCSKSHKRRGRIAVTSVLGCSEREPISGVTIVLFRVVGCSLEFVDAEVTNANGRVVFNNLRDGIYKVVQLIRRCIFEEPIFLPTDQVTIDEDNREFDIIIINKIKEFRSRSRSMSRSSRIRCRRRRRVDDFDDEILILIILFFFFGCGFFPFGFGGFFF